MRVQGFEMVTIVLLSQMVQHVGDPGLLSRLSHAVEVVMEKFWNPEYGLNNEILYHSYDRPDDENEDFIYLGHAIESMWMLLHEAIRAEDRSLFDLAAERLKRHLDVAWDDVYGGFFRAMSVNAEYTFDKVLWLQEEVLIGTMILMEHTDWDWPAEWFDRTFHYVQDKFPLKKHGHAMWQMGGDRKVTYQPHTSRKGNYHHPRHLMHNLLAIERIVERKGMVSDLWGSH
jgi:mannose/cellobiose epimerase-like protein (N-acyl-D-glucosamine 2-epimerase family)